MKSKLKLGLFGFGCVGQRLQQLVENCCDIEIKKICVRDRNKPRLFPGLSFTFAAADLVEDPDIDVIVETIDDSAVAYEILKTALENRKPVVTVNKKMLAEHLEEIYMLQQKHGKMVLYEGSLCCSVPVLRAIEDCYDPNPIQSIEDVFNGAINDVLTTELEEGRNRNVIRQQAQSVCFAEGPSRVDVIGLDLKFKLLIAMAHAFGIFVKPDEVLSIGINKVSDLDLKYARENGYEIKLVANAFQSGNKIFAFVAPRFTKDTAIPAFLRNAYNTVLRCDPLAGKQAFIHERSASDPVAANVLSDIYAVSDGYAYSYKKLSKTIDLEFSNDLITEAYISFDRSASISIGDFDEFKCGYAFGGNQYMVGKMSLKKLYKLSCLEGVAVILVSEHESKKKEGVNVRLY